ncbi:hypothetical protein JRO89_XS02G0076800 [Xanthoceras sorbifolium]|uniref:Glycosyltransferase n=1 Tax=Xanthoceras sorbifolium TaxID=99658 RepID=A0ABQ8IGE5_9ROSI|nr:hypothetical protein JRO89_XS02G0076800 [Xanthoceras sorbifolium]
MIPTVDMVRLFARHGVKATVVTTPINASTFSATIERERQLGFDISISVIKFPCAEAELPETCENMNSITSPEMEMNFFKAVGLLQKPFEQILEECRPHCLVADIMFPWATEAATNFGIPRLCFHGTGLFALSVFNCLRQLKPYKTITSDFEPFILPGLPDQMTSYGVLVNSFHELEPGYSEHYREVIGLKTWLIGPVSLCNRDTNDKVHRGHIASISEHECLGWLDTKQPNSVLYICFGSMMHFSAAKQLFEIAIGLESSGQNFIWVVKKEDEDKEEWLPEGFERRTEGRGFMTHCGWNSTLESVTAGVPMVTWPLSADQFYNEKLVTDVLRIGIGVGAQEWSRWLEEKNIIVNRDDVKEAVTKLMVGEEGDEMRIRAGKLKEMSRKATEEGGSSYSDLHALVEELRLKCT